MGILADFNIHSLLNDYKKMFFKSKKYWLIYLVLMTILGYSTIRYPTIMPSQFVVITFLVAAILGVFCIVYYYPDFVKTFEF